MPSAEILTIGTEILLGEIVDTNTRYIAHTLRGMGVDLYRTSTIGDNVERIADALRNAMKRAEIVERYAARSGRDMSDIGYYYAFATFKLAVVIQQIYYRYHVGQTQDARFAEFDKRVEALAKWARSMTQKKF